MRTLKIKNGLCGVHKFPMGSGKRTNPRLLDSNKLKLNRFFKLIIPSIRTSKIEIATMGFTNDQGGLDRGPTLGYWTL